MSRSRRPRNPPPPRSGGGAGSFQKITHKARAKKITHKARAKKIAPAKRKATAKAGQAARGKGIFRRPDGWGALTRRPHAWLLPRILYYRDLQPLAVRTDPRSMEWSTRYLRGFAIVVVFREASSDKPDRVEIDLVSLKRNTSAAFAAMSPTEIQKHYESATHFTRVVRVLAIMAAKPDDVILRQDALRRKAQRHHSRRTIARDFWTVEAVKDELGRVQWEGEHGTERTARATTKRILTSRYTAQTTAGGKSRPRKYRRV